MNWFLVVVKNYTGFEGRAQRQEYWMFYLFYVIFYAVAAVIDNFLAAILGFPILTIVFALGLLLPSLAVTIRRLHDIGKSGWWIFISLVPVIGTIWLLVLLCTDSIAGENEFGPNPKELTA